jgi:hypothetical protein
MQAVEHVSSTKASTAVIPVAINFTTIPCLYTKQKLKKRKTFSDGFLKVYDLSGQLVLYDAKDNFISKAEGCLESMGISLQATEKILQGGSSCYCYYDSLEYPLLSKYINVNTYTFVLTNASIYVYENVS